jgi:hypothetical protein
MNDKRWYIILSISLLALSSLCYIIQLLIFNDRRNTFFYLLQDISFVPINVLLVTLLIDKLLQRKEKAGLLRKINMIVGLFFTEIGLPLVELLSDKVDDADRPGNALVITGSWDDKKFQDMITRFKTKNYGFSFDEQFLVILKDFIIARRGILVQLMENPNLLEHDSFTDMLLAVFHLCDELGYRTDFSALPVSDIQHLRGDINRAYSHLITEWLLYMNHLKNTYPYLYSLALRKNPFDDKRSIIVAS